MSDGQNRSREPGSSVRVDSPSPTNAARGGHARSGIAPATGNVAEPHRDPASGPGVAAPALSSDHDKHESIRQPLWDAEFGTPRYPHLSCPGCHIPDEVGSHFDSAWCHNCGWRGSLTAMHAGRARAS